jgi:iron-sulfur cluster insertion protein
VLKGNEMNAQAAIEFTPAAVARVKQLIIDDGNTNLKLRVFISGGGCSGFNYGFVFDEVPNGDDTSFNVDGVTFLVDPMSYIYLAGATVDYEEKLEGSRFIVNNPNAKSSCGCGSSFSV